MGTARGILVFLVAVLVAGPSAGEPFWPLSGSSILLYDNGLVLAIDECMDPGTVCYDLGSSSCTTSTAFAGGADGDVYVLNGSQYCEGGFDPDLWGTPAPMKFLDLPLEVGKQWVIEYSEDLGWGNWTATVVGSVLSAGSLTTPLGDLDYFEVYVQGVSPYVDGVYYVNEQFGPIRLPGGETLVGASGTVPTAELSWGNLKAQYR